MLHVHSIMSTGLKEEVLSLVTINLKMARTTEAAAAAAAAAVGAAAAAAAAAAFCLI